MPVEIQGQVSCCVMPIAPNLPQAAYFLDLHQAVRICSLMFSTLPLRSLGQLSFAEFYKN